MECCKVCCMREPSVRLISLWLRRGIASALIEVLQLILCRGLFEFDDMIHNGFGCMLGSMLVGLLFQRVINGNLQIRQK